MPSHAIKNRLTMPSPFLLLSYFAVSLLNMAVVSSTSPFLTNTLGREWKLVGSLNMTDPSKLCPDSWQSFTSPRSCGKKTTAPCDSLSIPTFGFRYQKVCGRFRGYQFGSPDAFFRVSSPLRVEDGYVDGVSITYGSPGKRQHVYTYAAGIFETWDRAICPCTGGGASPPSFVGSDYYCESGNPNAPWSPVWYSSDVLWDGQQCGGNEGTCCSPPDLPWFCKTFPTPISEDLEVRICTDQNLNDENVAIESFELYIQGEIIFAWQLYDACMHANVCCPSRSYMFMSNFILVTSILECKSVLSSLSLTVPCFLAFCTTNRTFKMFNQ